MVVVDKGGRIYLQYCPITHILKQLPWKKEVICTKIDAQESNPSQRGVTCFS